MSKCSVEGCQQEAQHTCSVCGIALCDEHTEADTVPYPFVDYCEQHYEAWKQSLQDGKVGEAGAVYAFMGWLTSRKPVSGPFSSHHEASEAARLVDTFCKMQGWEITDDSWYRHLKPYVEEGGQEQE